jgi:uncharacterized protein YkwD/chitodextrinase
MKRTGFIITVCLCLLSGVCYAGTPDTALFSDPSDTIQIDLEPVNSDIVIRHRLVNIRFDVLAEGEENIILLNLFNDVLVTAIRDQVEKNASNGFAWMGHLDGVESGQVTLVCEDQKLAGTILLPDVYYYVRHVENDYHIVREVDPTAFPASSRPSYYGVFSLQSSLSSQESEVFDLVNQERAIVGLSPLSWDDRLFDAARGHSEDMAEQNYFSHDSLDGRSFSDRITEAGYPWNTCGENIALGYSTPQAVMNAWMNSPGHRNNILGSYFCDIGVGYAGTRHYWTQDFGRESGVGSCPVGNQEPLASLSADPLSGEAPLTVGFDASGSSDPDGNIVSYDWIFGDSATASGVSPTHEYTSAGTYTVTLTVTDNGNPPLSDSETITITVSGGNGPPVLDPIGDKQICEGDWLEFEISANDPDGDILTYSAWNLPDGAVFDAETHTFSWTPDFEGAGNYTVSFTVTDDGNPPLSNSETITIAVLACDSPPELDYIGDWSASEGELLAFTISASDPNGEGLTFSASGLPDGASFDPGTRLFSWIPNYDQAGIYDDVVFVVTDNGSPLLSDSEAITITVTDMNRPPVLAPIGNWTVSEGELLEFTVTANDPDGDALTVSASGLPDGASLDIATQTFTWKPNYDQVGTHEDVVFMVTDDGSPLLSDSETITITVSPALDVPPDVPDVPADPDDQIGDIAGPNNDNDAVGGEEENDGINGGDGNNDGMLDSEQENVTSLQDKGDPYYVTLESAAGTTISDAEAVTSPQDPPSGVAFPYGLFNFTVSGVAPGGAATVTLYLPDGADPTTFYKYGPEPTDPNDHWYEFLYDGETGAEIEENIIVLHFVDGERGDHDLDDTNGVIVDPGGPGFSISQVDGAGGDETGSGGCFIVTATISSPEFQHIGVNLLLLGPGLIGLAGFGKKFKHFR